MYSDQISGIGENNSGLYILKSGSERGIGNTEWKRGG
jgi:hypothetical protein